MSVSIKKETEDVFLVTVSNGTTTTHKVTVTNDALRDLTGNSVTKTSLLSSPQISFGKRTKHLNSVIIRHQYNFQIFLALPRRGQTMVQ